MKVFVIIWTKRFVMDELISDILFFQIFLSMFIFGSYVYLDSDTIKFQKTLLLQKH